MAIHERHLQFIFVVGNGPDTADYRVCLLRDSVVNQQTLEGIDANVTTTSVDLLQHLSEHVAAFFDAKKRLLFRIDENSNDYLVEEFAATFDDVEMTIRDGIE